MSRYTIKDNAHCLNTTTSYITEVLNNYTVADDRSQILTWLSPLDPGLRHWDIQERRVEDVGNIVEITGALPEVGSFTVHASSRRTMR